MTVAARLVDDGGTTLLTMDRDTTGLVLNRIDLGFPAVRSASSPLSGQDGELDVTQYMGGRAIVAEVTLPVSGVGAVMDAMRGLMHPGRRMWLYVSRDDWATDRMIRVRGNSFTMPQGRQPIVAQLGWSAPSPTLQDTVLSSVTLSPSAQPGGGMSFATAFPITFAPGLVPGASNVTVAGSVSSSPTVDMYGPCSDPLFRVVTTGQQVYLPGLTIAAGDFVRIDVAARTIQLNNDPANSRYQFLDFASSSWPVLPTGTTQVVFSPSSSSGGCSAVVSWRSQWL